MAQSFRDLVIWQKSMKLTVSVYELTRGFPRDELYGLTSQIRRSAISLPVTSQKDTEDSAPMNIDISWASHALPTLNYKPSWKLLKDWNLGIPS